MDRLYDHVRNIVVSFKLDTCCCVAPVRPGLLCMGYFNTFISLLFLVATADETFAPPLIAVQAKIKEDVISKPLGIVAYGTELAFNTLLLCGIHRNDTKLLRMYIYFGIISIVSSVLVYSIVFSVIDLIMEILIVWILAFQGYVIILVRSLIVEIRTTNSEKNGHVTLYSMVQMPDDVTAKIDDHPKELSIVPAITVEPQTSEDEHKENKKDLQIEQKKDESVPKLETINEHLKEN